MVLPERFLVVERIALDVDAGSKKRVLELLAELLQTPAQDATIVFEHLLERERLGSTGMGHGIALPHARIQGLTEARGGLMRLAKGIDFGAIDGQPVDMVFGLLVPGEATDAHLKLLASLAGLFRDADFCADLRQANDPEQVLQRLLNP